MKTPSKPRISFDLDEVLFVDPKIHQTEPPLPSPLNRLFKERLRAGTPELIARLQKLGFEVWIYTSSYRTPFYIRNLFRCYHVKLDGIINGARHQREVQKDHRETLPQKMPNRYHILLHVDDEASIAAAARQYGFHVFQLKDPDEAWQEKIIDRLLQLQRH